MKHRHIVMQANSEAHESLGQAQHFRAQPGVGGEDQDQVHEQQKQIEYVAESLQHLEANVGGLRSRVEKLEGLEPSDQGREAEDCEVD